MGVLPKMVRDRISGLIILEMESEFQIAVRTIIDDLFAEGFDEGDIKEYLKNEIDKM